MLVDSHCHLDFPDFADDLDAIVERAAAAGVGRIVTISTRVRQFDKLLAIAERFSNVYCSVGTHPHNAHEEPDITTADLVARSRHPKVVAIGEAGLDYHYDFSPRDAQEDRLPPPHRGGARDRAAARHPFARMRCRHGADSDRGDGEGRLPRHSPLLHRRPGARAHRDRPRAHISFTGILTFKRSDDLRAIAASLPADRFMVETDSPYLAPGKHRGKRNEPAYVTEVAKTLAETRGVSPEAMAAQTTENFFRLFNKVPRSSAAAA